MASKISDVLAEMNEVAVSGGQERRKLRQRAEQRLEEGQRAGGATAGEGEQEQGTDTASGGSEQERSAPPVSTRPRTTRGKVRKAKESPTQRDTVRHTLDLERPQHRWLKLFADDHRASTSQVMRVLLARLERDARLQSSVVRDLQRAGRAWVAAPAEDEG